MTITHWLLHMGNRRKTTYSFKMVVVCMIFYTTREFIQWVSFLLKHISRLQNGRLRRNFVLVVQTQRKPEVISHKIYTLFLYEIT